MLHRAPLPAIGNRIGVGTNLVGTDSLEVLALAEEHAHVRSEEFVRRACQKIAVERGHVDEAVRAVVDGVDVGERSGGVGQLHDDLDRINCADGVRGIANGDQLGAGVNFRSEVGDIEGAVFVVNFGPANGDSAVFCHLQPRGNVGVVIETGHEDLVPGIEFAADGAAHGIGQRRHVRTEDNFVGGAVQEVGHGGAGFGDHGVGVAAGGVGSAGVGIVAAQVSWRWRRSRAAGLAFRRGRRGRRRHGR